jgi:anion-transporting  ArsA/GET3 family ATPase
MVRLRAMSSLLEKRLLVVIGKGGVGKSTVSAALALAAARQGKRVLVCEVNTKERVSVLLDARPVGAQIGRVDVVLDAVNVEPEEAMREYALMILKFRSIYAAVFENRLVRYFLRAIPSLAETVLLGKMLYHVKELLPDGRPRYDLVIIDSPATGHGLTLLRLPQVLLATVPPGPMADEARWMQTMLTDPRQSAAVLVSLPEELPVNETLELSCALRDLVGMPRAALVLNGYVEPRLSPKERERLRSVPPALAPLAQAVLVREGRAELSERYAHRLAVDGELPLVRVPFLFTRRVGRPEIDRISRILEAA